MSDSTQTVPRPPHLTVAAALTALEGVVVVVFGLYSGVLLFTGDPDDLTQALMLTPTILALAVLPLVAARGLWLLRRWSRGPAMITQILALPTGWQMAQNGGALLAAGVLLGVVALTVLACVLNPTATRALGIGQQDS